MKNKKNVIRYLLVISWLCHFNFKLNAQLAVVYEEKLAKVKQGVTYIAMKDTMNESSKKYMEIFKKHWTYSKFQFINYKDIKKYISENSSFFTVSGYVTTTQFVNLYSTGGSGYGIDYTNTHLYLDLWTVDDKYFKNNNKEFQDDYKRQVARIELFTDFSTLNSPNNIYQENYDGGGHIRNWGPGILKNYLQQLMNLLDKGKNKSLYAGIKNEDKLKELKSKTLYIPDYVLIKFNKFSGDESERHDKEALFENYNFNYKLISTDELNNMILNKPEPFYYMIYIKSSTDKYVTIIDSKTGDIIYSDYSFASYNIIGKDLSKLNKAIEKTD